MDYTFEINSSKYGVKTVIAPKRFQDKISQHNWFLGFDATRADGRQFTVRAHMGEWRTRKVVTLHKFIWDLAGKPPTTQIDHEDGDSLNNAETNLRGATSSQNCMNRKTHVNKNGVKGVHQKKSGRWEPKLMVEGTRVYLGTFHSKEDAQHARDLATLRYHKDFAVLNPPTDPNVTPEEYRAILSCMLATVC